MDLDYRELGAVLAGLRLLQDALGWEGPDGIKHGIHTVLTDDNSFRAITLDEIDDLCEKIQERFSEANKGVNEGWDLIESDNRGLEIQRDDEIKAFASDQEAVRFVVAMALQGSRAHAIALKVLRARNYPRFMQQVLSPRYCSEETLHLALN